MRVITECSPGGAKHIITDLLSAISWIIQGKRVSASLPKPLLVDETEENRADLDHAHVCRALTILMKLVSKPTKMKLYRMMVKSGVVQILMNVLEWIDYRCSSAGLVTGWCSRFHG